MSVETVLKQAGFVPACPGSVPATGAPERRSYCAVPVVPAVPAEKYKGENETRMAERAKPTLDARIAKAYRWCRKELAEHPEYSRALCTVDPDAAPVLIAVAVRGVGCATLKIEKSRYEGREFELIELWDRADITESATKEAAA